MPKIYEIQCFKIELTGIERDELYSKIKKNFDKTKIKHDDLDMLKSMILTTVTMFYENLLFENN